MKRHLARFLIRWLVGSLGLWIAAALLPHWVSYGDHTGAIIIAGLVLAVINMLVKPVIVLLSLPAVLLSLGLFMVVINGFTVYLVTLLYPALHVSNFGVAILVGIVIGLVNYLVTTILDSRVVPKGR